VTALAYGFGGSNFASDGANVYWVTNSGNRSGATVMSVSIAGGPPVTRATSTNSLNPQNVATSGAAIYWLDQGEPTISGPPVGALYELVDDAGTPAALASDIDPPQAIAVTASDVYLVTQAQTAAWSCTVLKVPLSGGAPTPLFNGPYACGYQVAVQGGYVYWTGGLNGFGDDILQTPIEPADGGSATVVESPGLVNGLAADATSLYWADSANQVIMKAGLDGGAAVALATGDTNLGNIVLDGERLYWADSSGPVKSVGIDGGAPQVLVTNRSTDNFVAVDSTNVYWFNGPWIEATPKK
jgi:hypothetical protein